MDTANREKDRQEAEERQAKKERKEKGKGIACGKKGRKRKLGSRRRKRRWGRGSSGKSEIACIDINIDTRESRRIDSETGSLENTKAPIALFS